ncbi:MAG: HD domain-containing protein [Chitinispirillaceae bacterium]
MSKSRPIEKLNDFRVVAVIDIGSTAIRMTIARIGTEGEIKVLESLQQSVTLGRDTFNQGFLRKSSIEDCVKALKSFRHTLNEYGVTEPDQLRVVATTAVREALNKDLFLDRILVANDMKVEIIDDADISRITYLSARSYLGSRKVHRTPGMVVAEISGGSTEILYIKNSDVLLSRTYRLGSLRLKESLETFRTAMSRKQDIMANDIARTVLQVSKAIPRDQPLTLLVQGNDARLAAGQIIPEWNRTDPVKLQLSALGKFTEKVLSKSTDELVHRYHLSFADAETLGPSLLFYTELARLLKLKSVVVTDISIRHGFLMEMALKGRWNDDFTHQIIRSAIETGRKYSFNYKHSQHVAYLASLLFHELKKEHRIPLWYENILKVAALLHDIGTFVNIRNHHKHSMYLILNSDLFGLSRKDILITALTARYHRRSSPKTTHEEYSSLDRESRLVVWRLAAILRIADALDKSDKRRIKKITCTREKDLLVLNVPDRDDFTLEQIAIQSKGSMFEDIFGMNVVIRNNPEFPEHS